MAKIGMKNKNLDVAKMHYTVIHFLINILERGFDEKSKNGLIKIEFGMMISHSHQ